MKNVSLGFDLGGLVRRKRLAVEHIVLDRSEIEAGEYDLEGLFIRLGEAIDSVGASASCWTRSKRCSPGSPTREFCAPNYVACSLG